MGEPEVDSRLERIEKKIDKLGEAFVIMARIDEKVVSIEQSRVESNKRYDDHVSAMTVEIKELQNKLIEQDKKITENSRFTGNVNKLAWIILTAVAGAYMIQIFA